MWELAGIVYAFVVYGLGAWAVLGLAGWLTWRYTRSEAWAIGVVFVLFLLMAAAVG